MGCSGRRALDIASMCGETHVGGEAVLVLLAHGALDGGGAAAGADRGRGHRGDSLRGGIGAGERACVAGAAAGRDTRTQSGGGTDKGGRHRSERCCIGGVEAPCDVLERAIANQINSDDGWLHFAPVISLSK